MNEPQKASLRVPLFPLQLVLLPGKAVPLHIFEPRYKQLIDDIGGQGGLFAITQAHDEGLSRVGCTALIVRILKKYDDGRMDIMVIGQSAFRIAEIHEEKMYLEATVDLLADTESERLADGSQSRRAEQTPETSSPDSKELRALFQQCYQLIKNASPQDAPGGTNIPLSYRLAGELPLDLNFLQDLLVMRVEADRQEQLTEHLKKLLARLEHMARMRSRSAGNGHGPN